MRHIGGTTPAVLGFGALTAVVMGVYDYTGGSLRGFKKDPEVDEFERKETLRKNRRRPIEQTISELGEGRGMSPPAKSIYTPTDSRLQEFMVQVMMSDVDKGSRRSMVSTCQQGHRLFILLDRVEALSNVYISPPYIY
jgi:hypothetical protein